MHLKIISKNFNILISPINSIYKYEAINNFKYKLSIGKMRIYP